MIEKKNINKVIIVKIRKEFQRTKNNLNIVHLKELYLSYRIAYGICHTLRKTTILIILIIIIKNLLPFFITHFWLKIHLIYLYRYLTFIDRVLFGVRNAFGHAILQMPAINSNDKRRSIL